MVQFGTFAPQGWRLWFQDLADVGSGTSIAERFMREVKPQLKKGA